MLTKTQKQVLHVIAHNLGIPDAERRVIQRNIGGFSSSADRTATQEGFVKVMAFYEHHAGGKLDNYTPEYWSNQAAHQETPAGRNERLLFAIRQEAAAISFAEEDIEAFLQSKHMSGWPHASLETADAYWLGKLLTGLKAIRRRRHAAGMRNAGRKPPPMQPLPAGMVGENVPF